MINVIGLGYIGLPTALMMASHGMVVIMVKHDHIKQNWDKLKGKVVLDCHNICPLEGVYHI